MNRTIIIKKTVNEGGGPAGAASRIAETITQNGHGFSAKQAVYRSTSNTWALARADAAGTALPDGVVESVTDANTFVVVRAGAFNSAGLSAGIQYLSDSVAGGLTPVKPIAESSFEVPVMRVNADGSAEVRIDVPESLAKLALSDIANQEPGAIGNDLEVSGQLRRIAWNAIMNLMFPAGGSVGDVPALTSLSPRTFGLITPAAGSAFSPPVNLSPSFSMADIPSGGYGILSLTANTNVVVSGAGTTNGKRVRVWISNPANWTATWSGVVWIGAAPVQSTGGKSDLYELENIGGTIYAERIRTGYTSDLTDPSVLSASINATGDVLTINLQEGVYIVDSSGFALSGGQTLSFLSGGSGASVLTYGIAPAVQQGPNPTLNYTRPSVGAIKDAANNDLKSFSGQVVSNGSLITSLILDEGFEGTGAPSGFTISSGSGVDFDATSPTMEGAQCLAIPSGFAGTASYFPSSPKGELHGRLFIQIGVLNNSGGFEFRDAGNQTLLGFQFRTGTTGPRIESGAVAALITKTLAIGGQHTVWFGYKKGTGANQEAYMLIADGFTTVRPTPNANNYASFNTGPRVNDVTALRFNAAGTAGTFQYYDKVLLSDSPIL